MEIEKKAFKNYGIVTALLVLTLGFPRLGFADRIANLYPADARTLGMGGAGIAASNNPYAVFYNPANLASKSTAARLELLNLGLDVPVAAIPILSEKRSVLNLGSSYPYLKANPGHWGGYRVSLYPNLTTRFFSFGFLYSENYSAKYNEADGATGTAANLQRVGYREFGPVVALSQRFYGGVVKLGASARMTQAGSISDTIRQPDSAALSYATGLNNVTSLKTSAGMTLALPFAHIPTFSFVARNLTTTKYPQGDLPLQIDAGFGYTTYVGRHLHFRLGADFRDLGNSLSAGFMRKNFVGVEWKLLNVLCLRGGYGQGYPSVGLALEAGRVKTEFAWYSEEMGDGLRSDRNQRYMLQFVWSVFN